MLPNKMGTNSMIIHFLYCKFAAKKNRRGPSPPPPTSMLLACKNCENSCLNSTHKISDSDRVIFQVLKITRTEMNFRIAEMIKIVRVHLEIP